MNTENMEGTGIGQPVVRKEDQRLLTGAGCYSGDVNLPGQAYAVMVRSPHAHARIRSIDSEAACRLPGVLAILTGADAIADRLAPIPHGAIPATGGMDLPLKNRNGAPIPITPHPLLPSDKARFAGIAVAAVIGETLEAALAGAEEVMVDYEPLPSVTDSTSAVEPDAPLIWEDLGTNLCVDADFGDPAGTEAAFARAAHVVRLTTHVHRVTASAMELRVAVGDYDAASGRSTLYCCGDNPVRRKTDLAAVLRVPAEQVRVIIRDVGGNFGARNWFYPEYGIVAWAARRLKRPVKWIATRGEALLSDYQGRDLHAKAELALDRNGRFLALRSSLLANFGAYSVSYSPLNKSCEISPSVYDIPVAHIRGRSAATNTASTAPYRSSGRPEAMFIIERLIDLAASEHGFDRVELRRRNLVRESAMPYRNPVGLTYDSGAFERSMTTALALARWDSFPERRAEAKRRGKLRGIGVANYIEVTSGAPRERAEITVLPEGRVELVMGTSSAGQGHETSFAQCVSEWLGVPFTSVQVITGDTDRVPIGGGSHSARSMRMGGVVMGEAADKVIARARRIASSVLEVAESDIEFAGGRFTVKGTDRSIGLFEVAHEAQSRSELPEALRGPLMAEHDEVTRVPGFPYGTQVCELEIDPETGSLEITNVVAVDDVGRAINPLILHGQAHGGIAQGLGQALLEHVYYEPETGQMLAGSFMDYAMPRADNFPSFVTEIMEVPTPTNKLGVRGGGEGGTTPALAACVNAIVDALADYGIRHFEMPATPERVWRAIRAHSPPPRGRARVGDGCNQAQRAPVIS